MRSLLLLALLLGSSGCYVTGQALGQLDVACDSVPVEEYLRTASPEHKAKIALIGEAKRFAEQTLGFAPTDNYTVVYDTGGKPIVTVVTACARDRFEERTWWFPIVGSVPYLGYFDEAKALALADELADDGYDVRVGGARAYSTLGWFTDPILTTMFDDDDVDLVELILHELTHTHLYAKGHGDFNESLATFVAREATLQFFRARPERFDDYRTALARFADAERFDDLVIALHAALDGYYRTSPPDVLVGRERLVLRARAALRADRHNYYTEAYARYRNAALDNAAILARRRYGRTAPFRDVYDSARRDWSDFFALVRAAADTDHPFAALKALAR